jgi:hypothetical protein
MERKIDIPVFDTNKGLIYKWEDGFNIHAEVVAGEIIIKANKEGLISLANHLLNLAQDEVPEGYHMHFDEYNSLEEGSAEIIIQKI